MGGREVYTKHKQSLRINHPRPDQGGKRLQADIVRQVFRTFGISCMRKMCWCEGDQACRQPERGGGDRSYRAVVRQAMEMQRVDGLLEVSGKHGHVYSRPMCTICATCTMFALEIDFYSKYIHVCVPCVSSIPSV